MDDVQTLRDEIAAFLKRTRMTPTRFGRNAVNDPTLIGNLNDGRKPRSETMARIRAYLARYDEEQG